MDERNDYNSIPAVSKIKTTKLNNMNPKEKAQDLYNKMLLWQDDLEIYLQRDIICIAAKQCALITVDEILSVILINSNNEIGYWTKVKQEIENL